MFAFFELWAWWELILGLILVVGSVGFTIAEVFLAPIFFAGLLYLLGSHLSYDFSSIGLGLWITMALMYLACGLGFSILSWFRYCEAKGKYWRINHENAIGANEIRLKRCLPEVYESPRQYEEQKRRLEVNVEDVLRDRFQAPSPASQKNRLSSWFFAWPLHGVKYLLTTFLGDVWKWTYTQVESVYLLVSLKVEDKINGTTHYEKVMDSSDKWG